MVLRTFQWIWRSWPILIISAMVVAHWLVLDLLPSQWELINKTVALSLQIIGGILVLYSIDSNIGIIRGKTLVSEFRQYLAQFPLTRKSHVIDGECVSSTSSTVKGRLTSTRNPATVTERLDYLQEQIDQVQDEFRNEISDLVGKFNQRTQKVDQKIGSLSKSISKVESTIEDVSVGGIKIQIFGFLLLIHGGIAGYIA